MTDFRLTTAQRNLSTAQRNMVGTAARPLGTGYNKELNFQGVGLQTQIKITDRPVTQHGLTGIQAKFQGPGRQVYDRSYYYSLITRKRTDICNEINKFKKNIEEINKDNTLFMQLEKRYDELIKEVRNLEGTLADYNLALDKQRANTRPEDIRAMYEHIKMLNERQRSQLDDIFIERKSQEEQIQEIESHLTEINKQAQMKLNELDPEQRNEYEHLLNENQSLMQDISSRRQELEELNNILAQAENALMMDQAKMKATQLKEQKEGLERKKGDLEMQLNETNLSFPEARERLLNRIKEDNNFMTNTDKRMKDLKKVIENYEKKLREMQQDLEEKRNEEQDKQKYEILYQRDKEMTDFINSFEETRKQEMEQLYQLEANIVEMLENSSKMLAMMGALPSKSDYEGLIIDKKIKEDEIDKGQNTLERLQKELQARNADLKKLEQAEERVATEMKNLDEKINKMKDEMQNKFSNVANIKKDFDKKKNKLIQDKETLSKLKIDLADEIKKVTHEHDLKEKKHNMHDQFSFFNDFEKRMIQNEQQIHQLQTYIGTKSKDMNYSDMQKECLRLLGDLNGVILSQSSGKY